VCSSQGNTWGVTHIRVWERRHRELGACVEARAYYGMGEGNGGMDRR
jgi:hypothetical protein